MSPSDRPASRLTARSQSSITLRRSRDVVSPLRRASCRSDVAIRRETAIATVELQGSLTRDILTSLGTQGDKTRTPALDPKRTCRLFVVDPG